MSNSELMRSTLRDSDEARWAKSRPTKAARDLFDGEFASSSAGAKSARHRLDRVPTADFAQVPRRDNFKTQRSRRPARSQILEEKLMYDGAETSTLTGSAERLYFELMYCRGDARALALPEVEQLLDMACEAMRKLGSGELKFARSAEEWTALELYPAMK